MTTPYHFPQPNDIAHKNAATFLELAKKRGRTPDAVVPSAMGGIAVNFRVGPLEVDVEFYNSGTAHALCSDEVTKEMGTLPVPTNDVGYSELLDSMWAFFVGRLRWR